MLLAMMPVAPALAQSVQDTHTEVSGAMAGRSPHKAYRPIAAQSCRESAMHLPAGKPHSYGTHALRGNCGTTTVAVAAAPAQGVHAPD